MLPEPARARPTPRRPDDRRDALADALRRAAERAGPKAQRWLLRLAEEGEAAAEKSTAAR